MRKGTLSNGFEFTFDERRADMRFVDELSAVLDPDTPDTAALLRYPRLVTMLLGEDQKRALYDHIAEQNEGFVPVSVFKAVFEELISSPGGEAGKK